MTTKASYYVYWIHLPEHTDPFTEGYIGVSNNPKKRFREHKLNAESSRGICAVVERAITKHGESILHEVLIETSEDWAYFYESKLRPKRGIGWNVAVGGSTPSGMTGRKHSQETKYKMRIAKLGKERPPHTEYTKKKMRESSRTHRWITPFGTFETLQLASKEVGVSNKTVQNRCYSQSPAFYDWTFMEITNAN